MITYILAGGNDLGSVDYGKNLAKEIEKIVAHPKILSCPFSRSETEWAQIVNEFEGWFRANFKTIESYDYAKPETFLNQALLADVIYFHGGFTPKLIEAVKNIPNLKQLFSDKIIVGSSAGANMLSKNYWSSTLRTPGKGLNFVDANIMVHYGATNLHNSTRTLADWNQDEAKFRDFINDDQAIMYIPEGKFEVIEVFE